MELETVSRSCKTCKNRHVITKPYVNQCSIVTDENGTYKRVFRIDRRPLWCPLL